SMVGVRAPYLDWEWWRRQRLQPCSFALQLERLRLVADNAAHMPALRPPAHRHPAWPTHLVEHRATEEPRVDAPRPFILSLQWWVTRCSGFHFGQRKVESEEEA